MLKTNVLGLYRSHIRKDVDPDDVRCPAARTATSRRACYRRTPPGSKDMFIETDCTLQRL